MKTAASISFFYLSLGYKATDPLSRGRKQHRAGVASPVWPNEPLDGRFVCAYTGNHHKNRKSPYEPGVSQSQPGEGIHLNKRYHPHKEGDGEPDSGVMFPWSSGRGNPAIGRLQSNSTVICRKDSFCYTLWESDENNKSNVFVQRQGTTGLGIWFPFRYLDLVHLRSPFFIL